MIADIFKQTDNEAQGSTARRNEQRSQLAVVHTSTYKAVK